MFSRVRTFYGSHLFRGARGHYLPSVVSSLRSQVDYVVRAFYHLKVVFYYYYAVACVNKSVKNVKKFPYVVYVKSDGRFVKDVKDLVFFFS